MPDDDRRDFRSGVHSFPFGTPAAEWARVTFERMNIFRYHNDGRLAEEWIQTGNRGVLRQLGTEGL
jgi:hypothetical protein